MSLSNAAESDLLKLLFQNTTWAGMGDATGIVKSTVDGSFFIALHTADPGETGDQTTSEATYTGYARVAVARTTGGWTLSGTAPTQVANAAVVTFGACTAGSSTVTHFSIGKSTSGVGEIVLSGALTSPSSLAITAGITPSFAIGALVATAD
jgi:hypothetical protein